MSHQHHCQYIYADDKSKIGVGDRSDAGPGWTGDEWKCISLRCDCEQLSGLIIINEPAIIASKKFRPTNKFVNYFWSFVSAGRLAHY